MIRAALLLAIALSLGSSLGQTNLRIGIQKLPDKSLAVTWTVRNLIPAPGDFLFASYQPWESRDGGTTWQRVGEAVFGGDFENQLIGFPADSGDKAIYRVESIMDFSLSDFIRFNFSNGNLDRANFFAIDAFASVWTRASLRGANLQAGNFRFASLRNARLSGADCFGTLFTLADLADADLRNADLSYADLTETELEFANFEGADLSGTSLLLSRGTFVRLHRTRINSHTLFPLKLERTWKVVNGKAAELNFSGVDLTVSDLTGADLKNVNLANADLRGSDLRQANLSGANALQAQCNFVDWRGAIISANTQLTAKNRLIIQLNNHQPPSTTLVNANLTSASLVEIISTNVNMRGAQLDSSILAFSNLSGSDLQTASFRQADCFQVDFSGANLSNANFTNADLTEANLRGATTTGMIIAGARFSNTVMPDGSIRNQ